MYGKFLPESHFHSANTCQGAHLNVVPVGKSLGCMTMKGIVDYSMHIPFLSSIHVKFSDQPFNLFADDGGESVVLENAICNVF